MHMQGTLKDVQKEPKYEDVFAEVTHFFLHVFKVLCRINDVILDPGFGFGNNTIMPYCIVSKIFNNSNFQCWQDFQESP